MSLGERQKICPIMTAGNFADTESDGNHYACQKEQCQWWWKCREPEQPKKIDTKDIKIYHAGCQKCICQIKYGIGYCKGCQYRKPDWTKPSLKEIQG